MTYIFDIVEWNREWADISRLFLESMSSTESLGSVLMDLKDRVVKFFKYVGKVLRDAFVKLKDFLKRLLERVKRIFRKPPGSAHYFPNLYTFSKFLQSISCEYNIPGIVTEANDFLESYFPVCQPSKYHGSFGTGTAVESLKRALKRKIGLLAILTEKPGPAQRINTGVLTMNLQSLFQVGVTLQSSFTKLENLRDSLTRELNQFSGRLDSINNIESGQALYDELTAYLKRIETDFARFIKSPDFAYDFYATRPMWDTDDYRKHVGEQLKILKDLCEALVTMATAGARYLGLIYGFLKKMDTQYNGEAEPFMKSYQIPKEFVDHIARIVEQPLSIRELVITSLAPTEWKKLFGVTLSGMVPFNGKSDSDIIFISSAILDKNTRFSTTLSGVGYRTKGASNRETYLLSIIVHEATHVSDFEKNSTTGQRKKLAETYTSTDHDENPYEKHAFSTQEKYTPTDSEIQWIRSVLADFDRERNRMNSES